MTITCDAEPLGPHGDAAPDPAVAGDDELLAGEQHVGRADDPVDRRLSRAVPVVEEVLRARLVDGDDRELERAVGLHRLQADDAGGRLLHAGDDVAELLAPGRVQDADHVGAVVHRQLRLVVDRRLDVRVVRVVVLALDREGRDVELVDERRGDVVLRRERVRRAQHDVGTARLQRAHQVRRLGRHVQARRDAVAGERLLALEPLADRGQHRHLPVGPHDAPHALGGERQILHVVVLGCSHASSLVIAGESSSSGSEEPLVLALLPFDPGAGVVAGGEPAVDGPRRSGSRRSRRANASSASSTPKRGAGRGASGGGSARTARRAGSRPACAAERRARAPRGSAASVPTSRSRPPRRRRSGAPAPHHLSRSVSRLWSQAPRGANRALFKRRTPGVTGG